MHASLLIWINCSTTPSLLLLVLEHAAGISIRVVSFDTVVGLGVVLAYRSERGLAILRDNQVKRSDLARTRLTPTMIVTPSFAIFAMAVL